MVLFWMKTHETKRLLISYYNIWWEVAMKSGLSREYVPHVCSVNLTATRASQNNELIKWAFIQKVFECVKSMIIDWGLNERCLHIYKEHVNSHHLSIFLDIPVFLKSQESGVNHLLATVRSKNWTWEDATVEMNRISSLFWFVYMHPRD